jgi:hypothetical protein
MAHETAGWGQAQSRQSGFSIHTLQRAWGFGQPQKGRAEPDAPATLSILPPQFRGGSTGRVGRRSRFDGGSRRSGR